MNPLLKILDPYIERKTCYHQNEQNGGFVAIEKIPDWYPFDESSGSNTVGKCHDRGFMA
jgi:hypothetical protein